MALKRKPKSLEEKLPKQLERNKSIEGNPKKQLSNLMDYNREFSIFYSGVEYRRYFDGCYNEGVRNFLMSFEYLESKGSKDMSYYKELGVKLFIDSGAFTYISNTDYRDMPISYWEIHIQRYLAWAETHQESIFAIANLDLEQLVGTEQVWEWNKRYFEPFMLRTGIPVCFVWHEESGIDHFKKMCERYPYVGFSMVHGTADIQRCIELLSIAEENDTLVHGMGMTSIDMLTKLPFYTVDSTTWKSGLRYGMYVTWTGTSVKQFPKDTWEEKVLPYFKKYNKRFDMDLLFNYDEPEVIKASVYAFQCAEKYLRELLEPFTYWQKPRTTLQKIDKGLFPTPEWFEEALYFDIEEYAKQLNINPELRRVIDYIVDCTLFCWWEDEDYAVLKKVILDQYADGEEGYISESYDKYLNKISFDTDKMLQELTDFFMECVQGTNDKLLLLDTPYTRVRKERKSYVDSADSVAEELSQDEVIDKLKDSGMLTDELNFEKELDDEIKKATGMVVKRDKNGRVIGGNLNRPKPKSLIGNTPKIMCDNCIERNACPDFKRGYVCAYDKIFNKFDTRNPSDVADALYGMANASVSRLQRALVQENLDGGMITSTVSNLIDQNLRILSDLKKMEQNGTLEVLRRKTTIKPDGTVEEEQSLENPQAGGILAQLFSQSNKPRPDVADADEIERPPEEDE